MDDFFDSLIYIIIAIVAFAISILGKKKKKDARTVSTVGNENPVQRKEKPFLSNLEQLLKEEIGVSNQNFQIEYSDDPVYEKEQEVEKEQEILDAVPPEMLDDKKDTPYSIEYGDTSEVFSDSIKDTDITKEKEYSIIENFNMRDAIIYSEIINRKEY